MRTNVASVSLRLPLFGSCPWSFVGRSQMPTPMLTELSETLQCSRLLKTRLFLFTLLCSASWLQVDKYYLLRVN